MVALSGIAWAGRCHPVPHDGDAAFCSSFVDGSAEKVEEGRIVLNFPASWRGTLVVFGEPEPIGAEIGRPPMDSDDLRKIVVLVFVALLLAACIWVFETLKADNDLLNCVTSGRTNCEPLHQ
ncbi:hypothetical protein [Labrys neptuniae]